MICNRHYVRRCIDCSFDESLPLPEIKKRIIYLDQFVISNMMKELDPADTNPHSFYRPLFEKLDRLSKLQLVVCPESPIQDYESAVDPRYEKFRTVFRQLSHGISFHDATTILHAQIMRAFKCLLTIARQIHLGRKNFPESSMYNDIDAVAMYSPFCDAIFVDEIAHLTTQGELRKEFGGSTPFLLSAAN